MGGELHLHALHKQMRRTTVFPTVPRKTLYIGLISLCVLVAIVWKTKVFGLHTDSTPIPSLTDTPRLLSLHPDVYRALADNIPVVALESTIITHGMKYPENFSTAKKVEDTIRAYGAVPATIAILDGIVKVGLTHQELEVLAKKGHAVKKCSQRDIASTIAQKGFGSTTVAATMLIAQMAKIKVFVTGGIGGVHRGYEESMDVSNDLQALANLPVTVVCAGAKSILDIGRTLEQLETLGVTVVGYGTDSFPAFFTRSSGMPAPLRLDTPQEVATLIHTTRLLGLQNGVLVGVPVPEHLAAESALIETATQTALKEAHEQHINGQVVTPFLLKRVAEITGGESLKANINLILHNAQVGAKIAVELAKLS